MENNYELNKNVCGKNNSFLEGKLQLLLLEDK